MEGNNGSIAKMEVVMVSFMCQLDWNMRCPDIWLNIISGYVCKSVSGRN